MPTYDYKCSECGHTFEEFQSMSSEPLKVCPNCGKPALKRQMAAGAGMIFKGSGFYLTDYKKSGASSSSSESKNPEKKPDKPAEKKAEPKTESKPSSDSGASKPEK